MELKRVHVDIMLFSIVIVSVVILMYLHIPKNNNSNTKITIPDEDLLKEIDRIVNNKNVDKDKEGFSDKIKQNLFFFYSNNCTVSRKFMPRWKNIVKAINESYKHRDKYVIYEVDIDKDTKFKKLFNVEYIPTVILAQGDKRKTFSSQENLKFEREIQTMLGLPETPITGIIPTTSTIN